MKVYLVMYREDTDYNVNDQVDSVYLNEDKANERLEQVRHQWGEKWWFVRAWVSHPSTSSTEFQKIPSRVLHSEENCG